MFFVLQEYYIIVSFFDIEVFLCFFQKLLFHKKMTFTHRKGTTKVYMLRYTKTDLIIHIKEVLHNDTVDCKTKHVYKKNFLPINRGFR